MSWKRKRTKQTNGSSRSSPHAVATNTPGVEVIPEFLKAAVEKAADMAKDQLASTGRITPAALFVYGSDTVPETNRTIMVSLYWRNELQKETARRRIREKALAEGARAVVVLSIKDRTLMISGRSSTNIPVTASVDYEYQRDTRVVSRWEVHWLNTPESDFFLEDIFDGPTS